MDNGRFNKLFEMSGIMKADMANVKDDIKFLLKRTDEIHGEIIKLRTLAGVAGGAVGFIVSIVMIFISRII